MTSQTKILTFKPSAALGLAVGFFIFLAGASFAFADTKSIDFESYTLNDINGQDGWSKTGPFDVEVDSSFGFTEFGTKSLRISNAITSGSFGDQTFTMSLGEEAGEASAENGALSTGPRQTSFEAEWDFASMIPNAEQPGLAITVSPDRGDGARMSFIRMKDTPTGLAVDFVDYPTLGAPFVTTAVATNLDRTVSHSVRLEMDFVDGVDNDVVRVYVDGVLVYTGESWENYFTSLEGNPTRTVDSLLFRISGTAAPATQDQGFLVDNINLESSTPEVDVDGDGVFGEADICEDTVGDTFPKYEDKTAKNRWMLNNNFVWETKAKSTQGGFQPTIEQTKGCNGEQILEILSEKTGLDYGGEYKFGITKGSLELFMSGVYHVGPTLLETVEVVADDVDGSTSVNTLEVDTDYTLKAYGTANAGDGIEFDADFSFRDVTSTEWTDAVSTYEYLGDTLLDLMVDNGFVTWGDGTYHADHIYNYDLAGTGTPVTLGVYDTYFPGNTGSLYVDIIEDKWVDLW